MARILVISAPFSGHTNPTLPLVAELVRRGNDVGFVNAPKWKIKIEKLGAKFIPYLDYPENLSQAQELKRCFQAAYNTALSLREHYDILIYDSFLYMGKSLADKLGIPCIRHNFNKHGMIRQLRKVEKMQNYANCQIKR